MVICLGKMCIILSIIGALESNKSENLLKAQIFVAQRPYMIMSHLNYVIILRDSYKQRVEEQSQDNE